jgi:hypothetical protein
MRCDPIDWADLSSDQIPSLQAEYRKIWFHASWYFVYLEIENHGMRSRAKDWSFSAKCKDGETPISGVPIARSWNPPKSWPRIQYHTLDEIESMYLEQGAVYHVFFAVEMDISPGNINTESFTARFQGSNGEIVCRFASNSSTPPKPVVLRAIGLNLAKEMRDLNIAVPKGLTLDEEYERLSEHFSDFIKRTHEFKDRVRVVLNEPRVLTIPTDWCVASKDHLRLLANAVEKEAVRVAEDIPA